MPEMSKYVADAWAALAAEGVEIFGELKRDHERFLRDIAEQIGQCAFLAAFGTEATRANYAEAVLNLAAAAQIRLRSTSIQLKAEKLEALRTLLVKVGTGILSAALAAAGLGPLAAPAVEVVKTAIAPKFKGSKT